MAPKEKRAKRRSKTGPPPKSASPKVRARLAIADVDLDRAARLVKPALLYADTVTVYCPAAVLLKAMADFANETDSAVRIDAAMKIMQLVPDLTDSAPASEDVELLSQFLRVDRRVLRATLRSQGVDTSEVETMYEKLAELDDVWDAHLPAAMEAVTDQLGGKDLLGALEAGVVEVAPLGDSDHIELIAESLRAAAGVRATSADGIVEDFVHRLLWILEDSAGLPLLDDGAAGMARELVESSGDLHVTAVDRGREVGLATSLMGFLPSFADLPIDEALDLRRELADPLVRFRGEMARMSRSFESRSIDEEFASEVERSWREKVHPALLDVREAMAEHGLLRETASVVKGDIRRLAAESGGVVGIGSLAQGSFSLAAAAIAAAVTTVDVAGRVSNARRSGLESARSNAFYFLHRIGEV